MGVSRFPYNRWKQPQQINLYSPTTEFGSPIPPPPTDDFILNESGPFDYILNEDGSRIINNLI